MIKPTRRRMLLTPTVAGLVLAVSGCVVSTTSAVADPIDGTVVTVDGFHAQLAPYGAWVWVDGLGQVWRPAVAVVGVDFQPYVSRGHWVYTDWGWTFESDLPFAWATFHYGRWAWDPSWGWVWAPDTVWGPSWVEWRQGGGYIGWAPLPPPRWQVRVEWVDHCWAFAEAGVFVGGVGFHVVERPHVHRLWASTAPVRRESSWHGTRYYPGPAAADVERVTRRPVRVQPYPQHPRDRDHDHDRDRHDRDDHDRDWRAPAHPAPSYPGPRPDARPTPSYPAASWHPTPDVPGRGRPDRDDGHVDRHPGHPGRGDTGRPPPDTRAERRPEPATPTYRYQRMDPRPTRVEPASPRGEQGEPARRKPRQQKERDDHGGRRDKVRRL